MPTQIQSGDIVNPFNLSFENFPFTGSAIDPVYVFHPQYTPANNLAISQAYIWSPDNNNFANGGGPTQLIVADMNHVISSSNAGLYVSGTSISYTEAFVGNLLTPGTNYVLYVSYLH
jgi:hypothetical protein